MLRLLLFVAFLGASLASSALAAKKPPAPKAPAATEAERAEPDAAAPQPGATGDRPANKITGTFSTFQSLAEGEVIGVEVTIVGSRDGLQAIVQTADGVPSPPTVVPVVADGVRVSFPIPSTTGELMDFKGKVTPQGLTGKLNGRNLTLPRRNSFWQ